MKIGLLLLHKKQHQHLLAEHLLPSRLLQPRIILLSCQMQVHRTDPMCSFEIKNDSLPAQRRVGRL